MSVENKLPEGWVETKLDTLTTDVSYGYTASSTDSPIGPQMLRITDIQDGKVNWESVPYCEIDDNKKSKYLLQKNDLVFARTGATVGKSFLIKEQPPEAVYASYLIRVRVASDELIAMLAHFFNSDSYWRQITEFSAGIGQPNVNGTKLKGLTVPLPPLAEQQVIADQLDSLLAQVEATKTRLERIPDTLKRFRQSVLADAVSGKLTEEWRGSQFLKAVHLKHLDVEDREAIFQELSPKHIPNQWKLYRLKQVGAFLGGGTPSKSVSEYWDGDIPWVTPKDMKIPKIGKAQLNISKTGLEKSSAKLIPSRSILFVVRGMILAHSFPTALAIADLTINQDMKAIDCFDGVEPEYLKIVLDSQKGAIVGLAGSSTHGTKRLEAKHINNIPIPLPPLPEQQEIVRRVEALFAYADRVEQQANAALVQVGQLTQSILAKAFRGELTAEWRAANPELVSGDNSAEALLARIKEERAVVVRSGRKIKAEV